MNGRRGRHGMSTFLAVAMLGLVAMTMLAIGRHFTSQAQRTQRFTAEAQVRQLLLAGAAQVRESRVEGAIALPAALGDASLHVSREGEAYVITAAVGRHCDRQRVTYRDTADGLAVRSAVLEALP